MCMQRRDPVLYTSAPLVVQLLGHNLLEWLLTMKNPLIIPNAWSTLQCDEWVLRCNALGWEQAAVETGAGLTMAQHIRRNQKREDTDEELTALLLERWRQLLQEDEPCIVVDSLFPVWRTYRYGVGDRFIRHRDGAKTMRGQTSKWTVLLYLNDDFTGGETVFYPDTDDINTDNVVFKPTKGSLVMFEHRTWHASTPVRSGTKYVLRTDAFGAIC